MSEPCMLQRRTKTPSGEVLSESSALPCWLKADTFSPAGSTWRHESAPVRRSMPASTPASRSSSRSLERRPAGAGQRSGDRAARRPRRGNAPHDVVVEQVEVRAVAEAQLIIHPLLDLRLLLGR